MSKTKLLLLNLTDKLCYCTKTDLFRIPQCFSIHQATILSISHLIFEEKKNNSRMNT